MRVYIEKVCSCPFLGALGDSTLNAANSQVGSLSTTAGQNGYGFKDQQPSEFSGF